MKIEITKSSNPVADFFSAPLSPESEAELDNLRFADALLSLMNEQGISRVELARRMGIRPSRVTAMLGGNGNLTTQTKIRAARAVGAKYHHCLAPASKSVRWTIWKTAEVHPDFVNAQEPAKNPVTFEIAPPTNEDTTAAA